MRLQKYLASCGVASRRAAEKLIAEGHVTVDGQKITEMGVQVEDDQVICVDGKRVRPEVEKHYIIYHKPAGEVTTVSDPEGRAAVLDRFRDYPVRLYPVGRLAFFAARYPCLWLALLPPSPHPPSPPGKGETLRLFCRGLPPPAPLH